LFQGFLLERSHECAHLCQDLFVAFSQARSNDVLADCLTPQIITTITSRMVTRDEVHPMDAASTGHSVPAIANGLALELNASLDTSHFYFSFVGATHFPLCNSSFPTV
jgi:hypothetical protein